MLDTHALIAHLDNLFRDMADRGASTRDLVIGTAAVLSDVFDYASAMRKEMDAMKEEITTLRATVAVAVVPRSIH